jgi:hypothetical protein
MSFIKGSFSERAATTHATLPDPIYLIINVLENRMRISANREDFSFPQACSLKVGNSQGTGFVFPGAYIN